MKDLKTSVPVSKRILKLQYKKLPELYSFPRQKAGFRIRINLSCWIRIQEGKNDPQK
jgi:hypothetical protein